MATSYIFRSSYKLPTSEIHIISVEVSRGPLVEQLRLTYNESSITQVFRVYKGLDELLSNYLEIETHIGPIDISDTKTGKEVNSLILYNCTLIRNTKATL